MASVINVWAVSIPGSVGVNQETQTASAAQTVFNLTDFTFVVGGNLQVFINGVKQIRGASYSYTETSSSQITFTEGLDAGDVVQFVDFY